MNDENKRSISWKTCIRLGVTALIVYLCVRYWGSVEGFFGLLFAGLIAIISGLVISYVANIPMRFFERVLPGPTGDGTRNRAIAIVLTVVSIVVVLLVVLLFILPELINAIFTLAISAPEIIDKFTNNDVVKAILPDSLIYQIQTIDWEKLVNDTANWLQTGVISSLPQITSAIGTVGACFMGVVLSFWFLTEKNKLSSQFHDLLRTYVGEGVDERFSRGITLFDKCFHGYIVGQSLESVLFGSIVTIASTIAGMPDPLMLGALIAVMSLIPMVGALIGAILCALMIFVTSWQQAIIFLVLFFIAQQIEANFLYMRVVGKHVGLTGMWPLIGVTLGTALLGFAGAFLGVPLTAAVFRIVEADMNRRKELPSNTPTPLQELQKSIIED